MDYINLYNDSDPMKNEFLLKILIVAINMFSLATASGKSETEPKKIPNSDTMVIEYHPIGEFHTGLSPRTGAPRQGALAPENSGIIEIFPEYQQALKDLEKCDYIIVLYHMHRSDHWNAMVRPPGAKKEFGLFATRSPNRPNSIGFSVIKLRRVEGTMLHLSGVDAYDGTPVLDIKPWLPSVDCPDKDYHPDIERKYGLTE